MTEVQKALATVRELATTLLDLESAETKAESEATWGHIHRLLGGLQVRLEGIESSQAADNMTELAQLGRRGH